MATPEHIALAESIGYRRAWCYDSPALYPDVWMVLARAAERTSHIGLGPAVLVPSLRHPMVNAAAIATLAEMAPGRTAAAIGAGFTGRMVLGQRAMHWTDVSAYVRVLRALLRGEDAEWEGAVIRMLQPEGYGAARPVDVPILVGADGPKGLAVASELADGVFSAGVPQQPVGGNAPMWRALLQFGTVLADGETPESPRVLEAAGHATLVAYHAMYERAGGAVVGKLPGGQVWREAVESEPERTRHLAVHEGHLIAPNALDRQALAAGATELTTRATLTGTVEAVRQRLADFEQAGVTEVAYQPAGDIPRELASFASAAGL